MFNIYSIHKATMQELIKLVGMLVDSNYIYDANCEIKMSIHGFQYTGQLFFSDKNERFI